MSEPKPKETDYKGFKEFFDRHPGMDNSDFYAEFPGNNKSTIRSWKLKAGKPKDPEPPASPPTNNDNNDLETIQKDYIELLMSQTGANPKEFEGVDDKSKLLLLKNRLQVQKDQPPKRGSNTNILPNPPPIGQNNKKFGIDEFITFDEHLNEIRMELPMDIVSDPKNKKKLGLQ